MSPASASRPLLEGISQTHGDIIAHLFHLAGLGTSVPLSGETRALISRSIRFFERTVTAHHQAEEERLFPLVLAKAEAGAEREYLETMVAKLTGEHRRIEALWARLEQLLTALLAGQANVAIDGLVQELALQYGDHATDEESRFLPLCQDILQRSDPTTRVPDLLHTATPRRG